MTLLNIRDRPIKQKLMIIIMVTTTAALLLSGFGIMASDSILFRGYLQRDLNTLAGIIADNSTAALAFNDPAAATETLSALRVRTHLVTACIQRADGTILAEYTRRGAVSQCPSVEAQGKLRFSRGDITVERPIVLSGRRIGTLSLLYDLDEISERASLYGATVVCFVLMASVIAFLISSRLSPLIATPISQLVLATTSVSETNDYSIRAPKVSDDELGLLVDRFNDMLRGIQTRDNDIRRALAEREEALREAEKARERFHFMAESMPQKIFTTTPEGAVDYFNLQWREFVRVPLETAEWLQFLHPDEREASGRGWRHSIETGEPFQFQHRLRRADGVYRWHLTRAHAMRDAGGNITMWIGSNTDIHEQKEKEEELRIANDDLQQFAYSASHDLQEPVRNVAVYSELVAMQYHDRLDSQGQLFLGFLAEGGRRLATLINDLLAYTRAGTMEGKPTAVESSEVLKLSLASLTEAIRESQGVITHDSLPRVYMGEAHLQQVLQNLLSNALKYRKEEEPPQIHVSAESQSAAWRFSVRDNGIGIEPQYKEKIFGVFKRLHRDQKYAGTGIGLAICQRVVERYGGRIWVESEPGKGATFLFTIPKYEPRNGAGTGEPPAD